MTGTSGSGGIGDAVRKGVGIIHGTGEAIRGTALASVDKATGDHAAAVKNEEIANKGANEVEYGYHRHGTTAGAGTGAGVAPTAADRERLNTTHSASTNYGSHSTNAGNKLDPLLDSDLDHRGTAAGSTNVGPHSTNVGNKVDPRFDSDADHRANPLSSTSGHPAGSTNVGTHSSNLSNKLDPRFDSDADHRANPLSSTSGHPAGSTNVGTHSSNLANKLDPRFDSDADHRANPASNVGGTGYNAAPDPHTLHRTHEHRGSIGASSGLEAAQKLDPIYEPGKESMKYTALSNIHQHRGSIGGTSGLEAAERLDPPLAVRGPRSDSSYHQPSPRRQSTVLGVLDQELESDNEAEAERNRAGTHTHPQYDDRWEARKLDLRSPTSGLRGDVDVDGEADERRKSHPYPVSSAVEQVSAAANSKVEPKSAAKPHRSDFLNRLDPRIDRAAVNRARSSEG